ncbi:MAG: hypothetical protein AAF226_19900, partial [Verrucomicrobiota bacterium]
LRQILPILALITLLDLHWVVLQSVTWFSMDSSSIVDLVDGTDKCHRCYDLEDAQQESNERAIERETKTLSPPAFYRSSLNRPASSSTSIAEVSATPRPIKFSPPNPPPRSLG